MHFYFALLLWDNRIMLQLSASLLNRPVLSLRTGTQIATVVEPLINPDSLKIEGFYCVDKFEKSKTMPILLVSDIREVIPQGYAVNDHEALSDPEELIRLKKIIEIDYQLIGKQIITENKTKLGKVSDYATEVETMYIQKLYASQSLLRSFTGGGLSIDRNQIVELTRRNIIIKDPLQPMSTTAEAATA